MDGYGIAWAHIVCLLVSLAVACYFHGWLTRRIEDYLTHRRIRRNIREQQRIWYSGKE